jgi:hypothetical protein
MQLAISHQDPSAGAQALPLHQVTDVLHVPSLRSVAT